MIFIQCYYKMERRGIVVSELALGAGGPRFKSRQGQRIINFFFSSFNFHVNKIMMPRFDKF